MLISNVPASAHLKDSAPNLGANKSLVIPMTNGPNPRPIRLSTKNNIAEEKARIAGGTRLWVMAMEGPKNIL